MELARVDAASGAQLRGDTLHVHGPAELSSQDWLAYFASFNPVAIEWVSPASCNVVFDDDFTCKRALLARRTALDDVYQGVPMHAKPISCDGLKLPCSIRAATIFDVRPSTGLPASVIAQLREKEEGAAKLRRGDGAGVHAGVGGGIFLASSKQPTGRRGGGSAPGAANSNDAGDDGGVEGSGGGGRGGGGILDRALESSADAMEGVTSNGDDLSGMNDSAVAPRRGRAYGSRYRGAGGSNAGGRRVVDWDAPISGPTADVVERFGTASEPAAVAAAAAAAVAKAVGMPVAPADAVIPGSMVTLQGGPPGAPLVALVTIAAEPEGGAAAGGGPEITEDLREILQKSREGKRKARPSVWERMGKGGEQGEEGELDNEGNEEDVEVGDGRRGGGSLEGRLGSEGKRQMVRAAGGTNRLFMKSVASLRDGPAGAARVGRAEAKEEPPRNVKQRLGSRIVVPQAVGDGE